MSHIALYRKYRPQTFDEVLGQDAIVSTLKNALRKKEISHAYLFAGSRGTGKTSVARIFARELGTSPQDIYEIDAASHRGVNEVKELLAGVATLPFDSEYKVYILDEVHMFTKEAWNALLKTLEEPPKHVVFILATTELHKVLDTIKSRCQLFEFKKPSVEILKTMLSAGADNEKVTITDEALEHLARFGNGAFRDTWGIFEQVMSSGKKKITLEDVVLVLAKPNHAQLEEVLRAIHGNNLKQCLTIFHELQNQGLSLEGFLESLILHVRLVLFYRFAPELADAYAEQVAPSALKEIVAWSKEVNRFNAQLLADLLGILDAVKRAPLPEIALELGFMKIFEDKTTL